jgi:hypothetical protein
MTSTGPLRVLELGQYIVPAYAGMVLAEQGHHVTKWTGLKPDPIEDLIRGDELWAWINHRKWLWQSHARQVEDLDPGDVDIIIDNFRADAWARWNIDPADQALRLGITWVSMRDDLDERSFDAIAQARAWGDHIGVVPVYLGDTTGGLWLAFKALAAMAHGPGHHIVRQAAALAKLVEGEGVVVRVRDGVRTPFDPPGTYGLDENGDARVIFRGETIAEPMRDEFWRREHLRHDGEGRYLI